MRTPALPPPRPRRSCRRLPALLLLAGATWLAAAAPVDAQVDVNVLREPWEPVDHWADLSISGGYAFEQAFYTGYDIRNRDAVGSPEDRPFIALTVQGTF